MYLDAFVTVNSWRVNTPDITQQVAFSYYMARNPEIAICVTNYTFYFRILFSSGYYN